MGVFEMIVLLVLITTLGKVVTTRISTRHLRDGERTRIGAAEIEELRAVVDDLGQRLHAIEQERDFYKELLESPRREELGSGGAP